eukprot:SAG31_NODE_38344_length_297_cov_0.525253_1_plen_52_part_01
MVILSGFSKDSTERADKVVRGGGNILFHIFHMIYNVYTATPQSQQDPTNGIA